MQGVMKHLKAKGVQVIAYGPSMEEKHFSHSELLDDLASFKGCRDVLIANRQHAGLDDVAHKDYTRGLFSDDAWCLEFQSIIIRPAE